MYDMRYSQIAVRFALAPGGAHHKWRASRSVSAPQLTGLK